MDGSTVEKLKGQVVPPKQDKAQNKKWRSPKSTFHMQHNPEGFASPCQGTSSGSDCSCERDSQEPESKPEYSDLVDDSFVSFAMENQSPKNITAKTQWIKDQVASFIVKRIPSKGQESPEKSGTVNGSLSVSVTAKKEASNCNSPTEQTTVAATAEPVVMKLEYDIEGVCEEEIDLPQEPSEVPEVAIVDKGGLSSLDEKEMAYLEFIETREGNKKSKSGGKELIDDVNPVSQKRTPDPTSRSQWIRDHVSSLWSITKGQNKHSPAHISEVKAEIKEEVMSMKGLEENDEEVSDETPSFGDLHQSFQSKINRLSTAADTEVVQTPSTQRGVAQCDTPAKKQESDNDSPRLSGEESNKTPIKKEEKRKLSTMLKKMSGTKSPVGDRKSFPERQEEKTVDIKVDREINSDGQISTDAESLRVPGDQAGRSISPSPPSPSNKKPSKGQKVKDILSVPQQMSTDLTHLPSSTASGKGKNAGTQSSTIPTSSRKFPNPGKAFKIPKKLTFSELLHSQEGTRLSPDDKDESCGSLSPSPIPRIENEEDDSDDSLDPKELENLLKKSTPAIIEKESPGSISYTQLWITSVLFYGFFMSSPSPFITGAIYGSLLMYLLGCFVVWLLCPSGKSYQQYKMELKEYLAEQEKGSPVKRPSSSSGMDPSSLQKPRDLKGWLHFTLEYEQRSFSLSETKDVFVVLQGENLHIFRCKPLPEGDQIPYENLPKVKKGLGRGRKKRRPIDLKKVEPLFTFDKEHKIDLTKCSITIKPLDLPMRRIWNRKYPIELTIPPGAMHTINPDISFEDLQVNFEDYFHQRTSEGIFNTDHVVYYLLPNTGREKEDWFYRIQLCIKPLKHQITIENHKKGKIPSKPATSYAHYAVEVISHSQATLQKGKKGVKLEPHLAWFNALLGRAFWDVWHEPYWYAKVKQKIQHRLNKLNTPPFIKDIFIRDLHLGHSLPIIHKGSLPVLDEYGVWVDLQVTYTGEFTLTLETQLNVDYYAQLVATIIKQQEQGHVETSEGIRVKAHLAKAEEAPPERNVEEVVSELQEHLPEIYLEAINTVAIDEEDLHADPDADAMLNDPRTKAFLQSKTGKRVAGVVGWLAKSKIAKRVAETEFAKKAYEKAYEKFQKMPIILKVEVQNLKGTLAVNMPPPPTNRLWFGFRGNPAVLITAQPRIGERQVRLTYLTDWIERKLKEEFKKVFVLPAMQDFSIKIMNSRLQELFPDRPLT